MFILIERYINNLSKEELNNFAIKENIYLNETELDFSYNFIKKNWKSVLSNFSLFDINKYKKNYTEENFIKIKQVIKKYTIKYGNYLK